MYNHGVETLKAIARQVWQEFSPRDGEELVWHDDGIIEVTVEGELEGFDIDTDLPGSALATRLADRIQTIVMEGRQQMVPDCPLHPSAHPLQSDVVEGAAAWVCPWTRGLVRYMKVSIGAD